MGTDRSFVRDWWEVEVVVGEVSRREKNMKMNKQCSGRLRKGCGDRVGWLWDV